MRTDLLKSRLNGSLFALRPQELDGLVGFINAGAESEVKIYNGAPLDAMNYEVIESTAIISVDGAMAKKGYTGLCMSVFGYNDIIKAIDAAERDDKVEKIMFIIDSPGGSVYGVSELAERVSWASKPTVTYYENLGASAAIWGFLGADRVYASPTALIGSIGVMAVVNEISDDGRTVLTSRRAGNKICKDREDCMKEVQTRIDQYENHFYQAVMAARPGFDEDRIRDVFNDGGVIFADDAAWNGFIDGTISMKQLFDKEL